jgi:hypothetical protein
MRRVSGVWGKIKIDLIIIREENGGRGCYESEVKVELAPTLELLGNQST